ncbi:MAG: RlpA-like double-psi beta-barrel domain-containing protein, partial [Actinomycetota bacterium]
MALLLAVALAAGPWSRPADAAAGRPSSTAHKLEDQRARVEAMRERIEDLTARLTGLISELRSLDRRVENASTAVAEATSGLHKAEERTAATKAVLSARAREAYKRGAGWQEAAILLEARSIGELLTASRLMGQSIAADRLAYDQALASAEALAKRKQDLTQRREELFSAQQRLKQVRSQTQAALASEQQILANAQAELAALEEERRRQEGSVDARRSARQVELDLRLATLLAWIRPSAGGAGLMPAGLRSSEVTTSGLASWYGPGFHGRRASSGATFRQEQFTAASLVLPFGTFLKVTRGGRSVVVVVTDRGPYVPGRVLDLSLAA